MSPATVPAASNAPSAFVRSAEMLPPGPRQRFCSCSAPSLASKERISPDRLPTSTRSPATSRPYSILSPVMYPAALLFH